MKKNHSPGNRISKNLDLLIIAIATIMVLYHLVSVYKISVGPIEHQTIHLGFALGLIFLEMLRTVKSTKYRLAALSLLLGSVAVVIYIFVFNQKIEMRIGFPNTADIIMGIILVIAVFEASRQSWGPVFLAVVGSMILYMFFGHIIPQPFGHAGIRFGLMVSYLGMGLTMGVFGTLLSASANYIFLFIVFGALMQICGVNEFFIQIGRAAGKVFAGGPAQTAVLGSATVGMVTGAAMANVAITGAFTIPMMKKVGYKPEIAGAIEAAASGGGQVMPPVMGAAAFVMAGLLGIAYIEIVFAALIPAILYYLTIAMSVQAIAKRDKIVVPPEKMDIPALLRGGLVFLVPLFVMITLLVMRYSPMFAAFWSILALLAVSFIPKATRPTVSSILHGGRTGALMASRIAVALGAVGIMVTILTATGLGQKISSLVEVLSQGNLILALILTMILSIILGTGTSTVAAYILVAVIVAPALVRMGVPLLAAHLFAFYYAIMAHLTPPTATAALAASAIAGSRYIQTALHSTRMAIAGFIVPYVFVFNPILLMEPTNMTWGIVTLVTIPVALLALTTLNYGFFIDNTTLFERISFGISALSILFFAVSQSWPALTLGLALFSIVTFRQLRRKRAEIRAKIIA